MPLFPEELVLPRPGAGPSTRCPIPAPPESSFTETFGALLPPTKYVNTSNGKAAYYDISPSLSGSSTTTPDRVLLIHGVQTPALGLLPLSRALQDSFPHRHFVLFDLWGHGLSDTPFLPHESSLFHQLIDALFKQLEWTSAHLIGFSFGGALTAGYTASRTLRVESFTLIAPAGLMRSSELAPEEQGHMRGGGDESVARKWVHNWLNGGELVVPADWKERVAKGEVVAPALREWQLREHGGHVASVVGMIRDGGAFDDHATFVEAARTGIPSLAILGGLDNICSSQDLKDVGITNVAIVPEVGHEVVRQRVPEVATLISEFWKTMDHANSRGIRKS
ncbi:alpha/beta-hydrolase [Bimuria novae-zelandiae CBS 107.79]|uniref:Alpha/beta-hydrolase n=1 Tax=Bimuria novae-zelandiae CBS 107.79 TaxID=1447943 RepID=A0A6A5VT63_9PLEO|nr:alpha/beta-hydrolase [Bimuria novae-zelandiae CBS 107.79]